MSARHTPNWTALVRDLRTVRSVARAERRLHGRVHPETSRRLHETLARASAALAIDDAMTRTRRAA